MIRIAISIRMPYRFLSPHSPPDEEAPRQEVREQQESDFDPVEVTRALTVIPSDDHDDWILVGQALHSTGQPLARGLWDCGVAGVPNISRGTRTTDGRALPRMVGARWVISTRWHISMDGVLQGGGRSSPRQLPLLKKPNYLAEKYPGFDKDSCGEEPLVLLVFPVQRVANACRAGSLWTRWRDCPHHFPHTEADPVALLAQLVTYFGTVSGCSASHKVGESRHHANPSVAWLAPHLVAERQLF